MSAQNVSRKHSIVIEIKENKSSMSDIDRIIHILILLMLAAAAEEDVKTGKIRLILPAAVAMLCLPLQLATGAFRIGEAALGAGAGIVLLLLGYASSQAIGYGDGIILTVTGCILGGMFNFLLVLSSLLISALYSMIMLALKRKRKADQIPFIPFVLGGFVLLTGVYQ